LQTLGADPTREPVVSSSRTRSQTIFVTVFGFAAAAVWSEAGGGVV
jgi:hypothetical protein